MEEMSARVRVTRSPPPLLLPPHLTVISNIDCLCICYYSGVSAVVTVVMPAGVAIAAMLSSSSRPCGMEDVYC